tara:strand:- start:9395 stop:10477 length:1083 start_codon:yes stop_codon:yes gene_type:complete
MKFSDIVKNLRGIFERKRKNPIQLERDSNLESNLKFLKVDAKNTPIQISEDKINIEGSLTVNGDAVQTGTDAGATALNELSDVTYSSGDLTIASLDTIIAGALLIDSSGDITLDAAGADIQIEKSGTNFGSINTSTLGKLKLKGNTNIQVILESQGTGDILLQSTDDVTIDAADTLTIDTDGTFIMKKDNVEYSAANSAYAGMILGYSVYRNATASIGKNFVTINTTMSVLVTADGNKINVSFVAPPSGNVELIFSAMLYAASKEVLFSLSDGEAYNEVDAIHTYDDSAVKSDETDYVSLYLPFVIQGLTAGTSYQYWLAGDASTSTAYIYHGIDRGGAIATQPITFKAIALPATIVSEE